MRAVIDDHGDLFGVVNIVDALVVLLVVAVVTAGLALVSESEVAPLGAVGVGVLGLLGLAVAESETADQGSREEQSPHIQLEIREIEPAVAAAITVGDTTLEDDLRVTDVSTEPASIVVETEDGTLVEQTHPRLRTVRLVAGLAQQSTDDFRGDRLYVGRELRFDLDDVRVEATVVGLDVEQSIKDTPDTETVASGEAVSVSVAE